MKHYLATNRRKPCHWLFVTHVQTWKAFMLSERSQTEKEKYWIVSLTYELKKEA